MESPRGWSTWSMKSVRLGNDENRINDEVHKLKKRGNGDEERHKCRRLHKRRSRQMEEEMEEEVSINGMQKS